MGDSSMTESKRKDKDAQGREETSFWGLSTIINLTDSFLTGITPLLRDNPTLALTFVYLYATALGMTYSASLYQSFGIDILDYAEIPDFLLAAFKDWFTILSTLILAALGIFGINLANKLRLIEAQLRDLPTARTAEYLPKLKKAAGDSQAIIVCVLFSAALISVAGEYALGTSKASSIKKGEKPAVEVRYRAFKGSAGQVTEPGLEFIGATQRAAFFYDPDAKRTLVIPQAQLVSIEVPNQPRPRFPFF
jgi:hypothetical protein